MELRLDRTQWGKSQGRRPVRRHRAGEAARREKWEDFAGMEKAEWDGFHFFPWWYWGLNSTSHWIGRCSTT
jgi:hypothetical protein